MKLNQEVSAIVGLKRRTDGAAAAEAPSAWHSAWQQAKNEKAELRAAAEPHHDENAHDVGVTQRDSSGRKYIVKNSSERILTTHETPREGSCCSSSGNSASTLIPMPSWRVKHQQERGVDSNFDETPRGAFQQFPHGTKRT